MPDALGEKLDDLTRWCAAAFKHARNGDNADALTNFRRAAEAACKALLLHRYHTNRAHELIGEKSLRELIDTVIHEGVADRQVIAWLQGLQSMGNPGAHDNRVQQRNVDTGLALLRGLADWLYIDRLKRAFPTDLRRALDPPDEKLPAPEVITRISPDQLNKDLLETSRRELAQASDETRRFLQENIARVEQLIREKDDRDVRLAQERETARSPTITATLQPAIDPPSKSSSRFLVPGLLAMVALIALYFMLRQAAAVEPERPIAIAAITVPPGGINVLILPFAVLQDDPNNRLNFEEALKGAMELRIQSLGLPVKVIIGARMGDRPLTVQEAASCAERDHAALVLYGDLYEPTSSDSGTVHVKYVMSRVGDLKSDDMGTFAFRTLADTMAARVQSAAVFMMDLTLANKQVRDHRVSQALATLYATTPITRAQIHTRNVFRGQCHLALGDNEAALREAERCLKEDPTDRHAWSFLGATRLANGDKPGALDAYRSALERAPKDPYCMIDLARVLGDATSPGTMDLAECERLVRASLAIDTTNALAWQFLADLDLGEKRYDQARDHYAKSLALAPRNASAQVNLADLLGFRYEQHEEAEALLNQVLRQDSSNTRALFLLANLYINQKRSPELAQRLFRKSKETHPDVAAQALFGQAIAAFRNGQKTQTLALLIESWALDSDNVVVGEALARIATDLRDRSTAYRVASRVLAIDSMAHDANYAMGFLTSTEKGNARNDRLAIRYFDRSLRTDPYDVEVLHPFAMLTLEAGDLPRAERLLRALIDLAPQNVEAMAYLIQVLGANNRLEEALTWNTKALAVDPGNDVLLCNQATMIAGLHPERMDEAIALAELVSTRSPTGANLGILCEILVTARQYGKAADAYRRAISTGEGWRSTSLERSLAAAGHPI